MNAWREDRLAGELNRISARDRLIIPLDVQSIEDARRIVGTLGDVATFFKIHSYLHLLRGTDEFLGELIATGKQVFWDIKGADIPETMRGYSTAAARRGFSFMTIHGNGDVPDVAIKAAMDGKAGTQLKILMVTVLTSLGDEDVRKIYKMDSVEKLMKARLDRALDLGVDGVIASGQEADKIREIANKKKRSNFLIVTPGIRPKGVGNDDQKRAVTPYEAVSKGADYLVVGRPIVRAPDPKAAALAIIEEMQTAFDQRLS